MRRRRLLAAIGTGAAIGLGGCIGDGAGDPTPTPGPPTATFDLRSADCGDGDHRASVDTDGDVVRVTGTIVGSDTCDTAALESVTRDGDELRVSVITRRREMTGTPACAQCLTDLEYDVHVTNPGPASTVVVVHDGDAIARASI